MGDHDVPAVELSRLRRGAHAFLRHHAAHAWQHEHNGMRPDIIMPPDVVGLPARQRYRAHARQEARRLAQAQLYNLDADITGHAVDRGATIRRELHDQAVMLAGHRRVAATSGITAPAASGFLRWNDPGGIGCNALGAPVIACHWGPAPGGSTWLAWWADGQAMAIGYADQARAAGQYLSADTVTRIFGPLWYDHQDLLYPAGSSRHHGGAAEPRPAAADAGSLSDEDGTPGLVLLYTTLATWQLLNSPHALLSRQPVPAAEYAADRAVGLGTAAITIATAAN